MATKVNLLVDQGADFTTTITLNQDNGQPLNLANYTGAAQLRKHYTSSTATDFTVELANTTGVVALSLGANTTAGLTAGRYVYDVEITDSDGVVSRIVEGIVTVSPNVTRG